MEKDATTHEGQISNDLELERVGRQLELFHHAGEKLDKAAKIFKAEELNDPERVSNTHFGNAVDKAFTAATGRHMRIFRKEQPLLPLKKNESRYLSMESPDGFSIPRPRSCILNTDTGKRRLEIEEQVDDQGELDEPSVFMALDRGPIGKPFVDFLDLGLQCDQVTTYDLAHIFESSIDRVYKRSDMEYEKLESTVAKTALHGPWNQKTHWQKFTK